MKIPLVYMYCAAAALCFGTWGLVAKSANLTVGWLTLVVSIGTGAMVFFGFSSQLPLVKALPIGLLTSAVSGFGMLALGAGVIALFGLTALLPSVRSLLIGYAAGTINGAGTLAYAALLNLQGVEVSRTIPVVFALMPVFTVLGALVMFGEPITLRKAIGVSVVIAGIWVLS